MMRTILHLYFSPFVNESRAFKMGQFAQRDGFFERVVYLGYQADGEPLTETTSFGATIERIPLRRVPLLRGKPGRAVQLLVWFVEAVRRGRRMAPDAVQAHSLAALIPSAFIRRAGRSRLVYDAHELETERHGWPGWLKAPSRFLERRLIRRADHVLVVSPLIADWYREHYPGTRVATVRNVPAHTDVVKAGEHYFQRRFAIPDSSLVFLYQGALGHGRGLELLMDVFRQRPAGKHLVIMGSGPMREAVVAATRECPHIHYHPAVPFEGLLGVTACADVGLVLIEDSCLSYRYSLANKTFEYLHAGIAVLASALPEYTRLLEGSGRGWVVDCTPAAVRATIERLDRAEIDKARQGAPGFRAPLWEDEFEHVRKVYRSFDA